MKIDSGFCEDFIDEIVILFFVDFLNEFDKVLNIFNSLRLGILFDYMISNCVLCSEKMWRIIMDFRMILNWGIKIVVRNIDRLII